MTQVALTRTFDPWRFRVDGGPADGSWLIIRQVDGNKPSHTEPVPDGWRLIGQEYNRISDLEDATTFEVLTDAPHEISHHDGYDAREALLGYLATEAVVCVIAQRNYPPVVSWHDLNTIRTVRPDYPEPPIRVQLWPGRGPWVEDVGDVWKIDPEGLVERRGWSRGRVAMLGYALGQSDGLRRAAGLTHTTRAFDRYDWYRDMRKVTSVNADRRTREAARAPGVHTVREITLEVRAGKTRRHRAVEMRKIRAPMWLADFDTLVVTEGFVPTVELLVPFMEKITGAAWGGKDDAVRRATELLGLAGDRHTHAKMEQTFEQELRDRVGGEFDVTVSIRPKIHDKENER